MKQISVHYIYIAYIDARRELCSSETMVLSQNGKR